jgi:biotin carboxyl carrier protein
MVNDSVGALHVALAAAIVGWLVFCISHAIAVWNKRNAKGETQSSLGLLFLGLLLAMAALAAGWMDRELTRRAGVILGTDFFVVHAHARTIPHLTQGNSVEDRATLATFDDPATEREQEQLRGEIHVLERQIASTRLKPLLLDPELIRASQDASESQRARLGQLGYGVLNAPEPALNEDKLVAAEQAKNDAAKTQLERTTELVHLGIVARAKLDPATVAAQKAAQELRERENLIQATKEGSQTVQRAETAVVRDEERAQAERSAELAELEAKAAEFRTDLLELNKEERVTAPFSGTVVYRHPTPALADDGQVILALAEGSGFQATVQIPTREALMLTPGRELRLKLKHSLVSDEVVGRLKEIRPVAGYRDRSDLVIACNLPPEQFKAFSSGLIPVTLQWRPPLYTERISQAGLLLSIVPMFAWLITRVRAQFAGGHVVEKTPQPWTAAWLHEKQEEEEFRRLGIQLGEGRRSEQPSTPVSQ